MSPVMFGFFSKTMFYFQNCNIYFDINAFECCFLIATLLLAIGQVRKSARESGISFKEYGMVTLL